MPFDVALSGFDVMTGAIDEFIDVVLEDDTVWVVGTNVEYAIFQEYGTRHHEPQPYLRPAAEEAQANMGEIVANEETVQAGVKETAMFIEKRAKELAPVDTGNLRASIRAEKVE